VLFCFCLSWAVLLLFPRAVSSLALAMLSTTSLEGTTKAQGHHHDRLNDQGLSSRLDSSSNSSSNSLSNSSSPSPSSSSSSNSSSSSPSLQGNSSSSNSSQLPPHSTQDPQQLQQLLQGLLEGQVFAEQQLQTTFGRIQGTTFSEGTWQLGRLAAPHSSSTRPRLTASRWAWSRSPSTAPPSRTTSTD